MPPRQSARLSAKLVVENTTHSIATVPAHIKHAQRRPQKKQKIAVKTEVSPAVPVPDDFRRIRGRKGVLKTMTEMPVDILLEIFKHVEPVDLLHLSRATKDLRALILDDNSAFLWQQVYRNISKQKPPPCPPGTKFVHYTNLLYGRNCNFCASKQGKIIHWSARARLCHNCAAKQLLQTTAKLDQEIVFLCSKWYFPKSTSVVQGAHILKAQYDHHMQKYQAIRDPKAKVDYKKVAMEEIKERSGHAKVFYAWEGGKKRKTSLAKAAIITNRRNAIIIKLKEEGYGPELRYYQYGDRYGALRLPGVNVASELTDKVWERIKPDIIEVLETKRQAVRKEDITRQFRKRIFHVAVAVRMATDKMPQPCIIPPLAHFARSEPFNHVIRNDALQNNTFSSTVKALEREIPDIIASWKSEVDRVLFDLIEGKWDIKLSEVNVNPLELATTFFKCRWCDDPISYPRILMHNCLRDRPYKKDEELGKEDEKGSKEDTNEEEADESDDDDENAPKDLAARVVAQVTPDSVWNEISSWYGCTWNEGNDQVFVDEEASGFAAAIVKACGEDPRIVTFSKMDEINARLECVRCSDAHQHKPRNRPVMDWRMAILHDIEMHYEDPPAEKGWRLLTDEEDLAKVKQCEAKMSGKWKIPDFHCRPCESKVPGNNVRDHMASHGMKHAYDLEAGRPEVQFKDTIYLPLDTSMKIPPYAVKI